MRFYTICLLFFILFIWWGIIYFNKVQENNLPNPKDQNISSINMREKFTALPEKTKWDLLSIDTNIEKIDILIDDLKRDRSVFLSLYNLPDMTENLVNNIESWNKLIEFAKIDISIAEEIWNEIYWEIQKTEIDTTKWILVHYLAQIENITELSWNLPEKYTTRIQNPDNMSYFDYYLVKHYTK